MAKKLYDLVVKTGEYTNRNGESKGRFLNIGAVMATEDGGKFLLINRTFNPAGVPDLSGRGGDSVLVSMFDPEKNQDRTPPQSPEPQPRQQQAAPRFDDDIPF